MRYLGIDYGGKRTGIALSDEGGIIAFPRETLSGGNEQIIKKIGEICEKEEVGEIIVGLPISFQGKETAQTKEVKNFAEKLKKAAGLPLEFENEILTSRMVERDIKEGRIPREKIDAASAAVILQSYLDRITR